MSFLVALRTSKLETTIFVRRVVVLSAMLVGGLTVKLGPILSHQKPILSHQKEVVSASDPQLKEAAKLRDSGQLTKAAAAFDRLAISARNKGNRMKEAKALLAEGGVRLRLFDFRVATQMYARVIELASELQDDNMRASALVNLADIHIRLNNPMAAESEINSAIDLLHRNKNPSALARTELELGLVEQNLGKRLEAAKAYQSAVSLAEEGGSAEDEALAWLVLGEASLDSAEASLDSEDLSRAEQALLQSYRVSILHKCSFLPLVRMNLAELERRKGHPGEALRRLDDVLREQSLAQYGIAKYEILLARAEILADLARNNEALALYRQAVAAATDWRRSSLPGEVSQSGTIEAIHQVYTKASDFLASLTVASHNPHLAREALEMIATNRSADLHEQRTISWQREGLLPDRYYKLINQLRSAEESMILRNTQDDETERTIRQIKADLGLLETQLAIRAETRVSAKPFGSRRTITATQHELGQDDVLFSFSLGKKRSWLWAVTKKAVNLFELADEATSSTRL